MLLSTYNGEGFLCEQLDSLIAQEGVDISVLVRDDGSSDGTWNILIQYQKKYPKLFELIQGDNIGCALSFTELLKEAFERYLDFNRFAFCDQDDVWLPLKLKSALDNLKEEDDTLPLSYCSNTAIVDIALNFEKMNWREDEVVITKKRSLIQSFATGCTMVFNRIALEIYVKHIPDTIWVHDYQMYQICVFLGKVVWDSNSYILYRQHGKNQLGANKGFWGKMKKRTEGRFKEHIYELQGKRFLESLRPLLTKDDIILLTKFVFYKKNIISKLELLLDRDIKYSNFESNFFFLLKVIIGSI